MIIYKVFSELFNDGGIRPSHKETSPSICGAKQWTDFYMIGRVNNVLPSSYEVILLR